MVATRRSMGAASVGATGGKKVAAGNGLTTSELGLLRRIENDPSLLLTPRYKVLSEWIARMDAAQRQLASRTVSRRHSLGESRSSRTAGAPTG